MLSGINPDFGVFQNMMDDNSAAALHNQHYRCKNNLIMDIRPVKTEQDYKMALSRIEELWGAKKDSPESDELDLLATLVESYEMKHYPISPPDPVDAIKFRMEQMGMSNSDTRV